MRFPLTLDLLRRLPRHPDWKYELLEGEALLSPRPRPLRFRRRTDAPVSSAARHGADVRPVETERDRDGLVTLLMDVWREVDPYRSLERDDREEELRRAVERDVEPSRELEGAIALDADGPCACALIAGSSPPTLSWLSVRKDTRDQGLATALLSVVLDGPRGARGGGDREPLLRRERPQPAMASLAGVRPRSRPRAGGLPR